MPVVVNKTAEPKKEKGDERGPHVSPVISIAVLVAVLAIVLGIGFFFLNRGTRDPLAGNPAAALSGDDYGQPRQENADETAAAREAAKSFQESDSPGGE